MSGRELMWYVDTMPSDSYCWEWTGGKVNGYGYYRSYPAHRLVYEKHRGSIAPGMQLDHLCRNRSCVKPDHLEPVTQQENLSRGFGLHRVRHCNKGHEYTEENTGMHNGWRRCKECHRQQERNRRAAS